MSSTAIEISNVEIKYREGENDSLGIIKCLIRNVEVKHLNSTALYTADIIAEGSVKINNEVIPFALFGAETYPFDCKSLLSKDPKGVSNSLKSQIYADLPNRVRREIVSKKPKVNVTVIFKESSLKENPKGTLVPKPANYTHDDFQTTDSFSPYTHMYSNYDEPRDENGNCIKQEFSFKISLEFRDHDNKLWKATCEGSQKFCCNEWQLMGTIKKDTYKCESSGCEDQVPNWDDDEITAEFFQLSKLSFTCTDDDLGVCNESH